MELTNKGTVQNVANIKSLRKYHMRRRGGA